MTLVKSEYYLEVLLLGHERFASVDPKNNPSGNFLALDRGLFTSLMRSGILDGQDQFPVQGGDF